MRRVIIPKLKYYDDFLLLLLTAYGDLIFSRILYKKLAFLYSNIVSFCTVCIKTKKYATTVGGEQWGTGLKSYADWIVSAASVRLVIASNFVIGSFSNLALLSAANLGLL